MTPMSDNMRGAVLMIGAMAMFTSNDACLKLLSTEAPLMQLLFLRGIAVTGALVVWMRLAGGFRLPPPGPDRLHLALRTAAEIAAAYCFLTAVFNMPLANVSAIHQATPLTVTLAAALFLREPIGWRRATAIVVGFAGVLLIVRPGADGFTVYSLYAIGAVFCVAARDLVTRRMSAGLPSLVVALVTSVGVTAFAGAVAATQPWLSLGGTDWAILGLSSVCVLLAYVLSIAAMRVGEVAVVAPFRYSGLLVALAIGYVLFDDLPGPLTLIGAAIVVGTGLFTFFRESGQVPALPPANVPGARPGEPGPGGPGRVV